MSADLVQPLSISVEDLSGWDAPPPFAFQVAASLANVLPRGQGRVSKIIGHLFCRERLFSIRTPSGARLAVDWRNVDFYTVTVLARGRGTERGIRACTAILRRGDVLYDIGANAGFISVEAISRCGGCIEVVAFEPQPSLARAAAASAALNGHEGYRVYPVAVGEQEGSMDLYVSTFAIHASFVARERGARRLQVPVVTLDGLAARDRLPPPRLIKVDVEGAEALVFRGGARLIATHTPYILFEADENAARFGMCRAALCELLRSYADYRFCFATGEGFVPAEPLEDPRYGDLLAVPPGETFPPLER